MFFCSVCLWPADECEQRTSCLCNQNYSSWESKAGGQHQSGWSWVWSYSTLGSHNRRMHTYPHGPQKMYKETAGYKKQQQKKLNTSYKQMYFTELYTAMLMKSSCYNLRHWVYTLSGLRWGQAYFVDKSAQESEDLFECCFWLIDLQETQMDCKHFFHQGVVPMI